MNVALDRFVVLRISGLVAREPADSSGHLVAALRAAERIQTQGTDAADEAAQLALIGVPRFVRTSNCVLTLKPAPGLSLVDRVLVAMQRRDPRTSPRSSHRIRDFLDFLIDEAIASCR